MAETPEEIRAARAIEDRAIELGDERGKLDDRLGKNTEEIVTLLREWEEAPSGIALERLASLVGVSRQTLYRWRDVIARLKADAAEE
jgi:hypothetical protein